MGDVQSGTAVAVAVAQPDDCGRCRMTFFVGVVMMSFLVLGYFLIGPEKFEFEVERKRPDNMFLFVAGIVCLVVGVCFYILFGSLLQEWEFGHPDPEGRRLVDELLLA